MKKVILALAIVSVAFAACNEGDKKVEETKVSDTTVVPTTDTTMVVKDTTVKTTTTIDTLKK
ncbi:MAG TPA: hypothetical protein VK484_12325 [Ferruginibacter sp.]|nr:hypothetical protein [Ferruginibacter sp.]